jgi:predicted Holliday junction resolvase-like endonuclease
MHIFYFIIASKLDLLNLVISIFSIYKKLLIKKIMMKRTLTKSKSKFSTLNKTTKSDDKNIKQNEKLHTNTNSSIGKNKKNKNN